MDSIKVIDTFTKALSHAGITPRDISPVLGLHLSSLYRILAGRTPTSIHTLRSLEMATVFLRWIENCGIVGDSTLALYLRWIEG